MIACIHIFPGHPQPHSVTVAASEKLGREITLLLIARTPGVERLGQRAWFVDIAGCERLFHYDFAGWALQIAGLLKTHCSVIPHIGIASNKATAELACRLANPGAALWLFPEGEKELLRRAPIEQLPRLGDEQRHHFHQKRIQWVWEARQLGEATLRQWFGNKDGSEIWRVLHGICNDPVKPFRMPRLLKKTHIFASPTTCQQDVIRAGVYLAGNLYHETQKLGGVLRKLSCRLTYVDCLETLREVHTAGLQQEEEYAAAAARMLESLPLRRVQVQSLMLKCPVEFEATQQQDLFSERERLRRRDLEQALADVREKYGVEALHRASGTTRRRPRSGWAW